MDGSEFTCSEGTQFCFDNSEAFCGPPETIDISTVEPALIYCEIDDSYRTCGSDQLYCVDNSEKYCPHPKIHRDDDGKVEVTNVFNFHTPVNGDILCGDDCEDSDSDDDQHQDEYY